MKYYYVYIHEQAPNMVYKYFFGKLQSLGECFSQVQHVEQTWQMF